MKRKLLITLLILVALTSTTSFAYIGSETGIYECVTPSDVKFSGVTFNVKANDPYEALEKGAEDCSNQFQGQIYALTQEDKDDIIDACANLRCK